LSSSTETPSTPNASGVLKLFTFFETLTPEQRVLFEQLHFFKQAPEATADADDSPPQGAAGDLRFYSYGNSVANNSEVVLLAALLFIHFEGKERGKLHTWLDEVAEDKARMDDLGENWRPEKSSSLFALEKNEGPNPMKPYDAAVRVYPGEKGGGSGVIETASAMLAKWPGGGRTKLATPRQIASYLRELQPKAKGKKSTLLGPKYDAKSPGVARHVAAIPAVAALLRDRTWRGVMRKLFVENEVSVEGTVRLSLFDAFKLLDSMEVEVEQSKEKEAEKQAKLTAAHKLISRYRYEKKQDRKVEKDAAAKKLKQVLKTLKATAAKEKKSSVKKAVKKAVKLALKKKAKALKKAASCRRWRRRWTRQSWARSSRSAGAIGARRQPGRWRVARRARRSASPSGARAP